jgi:hypothetical protein
MEHSYRNLQSRTTWLCRLLYLAVALDAVSLISNGYQRMVLQQAVDGSYESTEALQASAEASDLWQHLISIPTLALMLLTFVLAGIWIYRASANLRSFGASRLPTSPGWAVGWYFIPFANLLKPFQAMSEIWRASTAPLEWEQAATPPLLRLWWALWLVNGFLGNITFRVSMRAEEVEALLNANSLLIASDLVSIPLSLVFARMLHRIGEMQARQSSLAGLPPELPAPI